MNDNLDIGLQGAQEQVVDLSKELLVLRLAFGKLKATLRDAFAPISAVLVEGLQQAVYWATRLVRSIGKVVAALFGVKAAQTGVLKTVSATGAAVKRSLAGFDRLNRLSNGSDAAVSVSSARDYGGLTQELSGIVSRIMELLRPLQELDLLPLRWNLARLSESFTVLKDQVGQGVQWLWLEVLAPFTGWVTEKLAPLFLKTLKEAIEAVSAVLAPLGEGFTKIYEALQPVFSFVGSVALTVLDRLRILFSQVGDTFREKGTVISDALGNVAEVISALWELVAPLLEQLRISWALTFSDMAEDAADIAGHIIEVFGGITTFLSGVFTGNWDRVMAGLGQSLKGGVNTVIGFLNLLLSGFAGAVNTVVRLLNKLSFTAPDWVPGIGGETFGFNLKTMSAPQIPYLAKGAVLPANKPFLAVVGDQRNGKNIEAPLKVIEEAVAAVMADQLGALVAGFEATVGELQQLRRTVADIEVGDTVIGQAADRYRRKMAVINGRAY